jgi:AraC-like DNA-binding protein
MPIMAYTIREYAAPLIGRHRIDWGPVSVEVVERHLSKERSKLQFRSSQHALFVELTGGCVYERSVNGGHAIQVHTSPKMISFRPANIEVFGWSEGVGKVNYAALLFDPDKLSDLWEMQDLPRQWSSPTCIHDIELWEELEPLLRRCQEPEMYCHPISDFYIQGRTLALFAMILDRFGRECYIPPANSTDRRLRRVLQFLKENTSGNYTLSDLAAMACVSPPHLVRLFKKVYGITPMAYASSRRISEARRLLIESDTPIAELAAQFGFNDQSHFTRLFKTAVGVTPARFRANFGRSTSF